MASEQGRPILCSLCGHGGGTLVRVNKKSKKERGKSAVYRHQKPSMCQTEKQEEVRG